MPCAQPWPRTCGSLKLVLLGSAYAYAYLYAGDGMTSQDFDFEVEVEVERGLDKRTSGE